MKNKKIKIKIPKEEKLETEILKEEKLETEILKEEKIPIELSKEEKKNLAILNLMKVKELKPSKINNRIHFKVLVGEHIVLFLHREDNISYIIAKQRIYSLQECVTIKSKKVSFVIDTKKPTFVWGNMRLYLIDCESSQQVSLQENEKIINIHTVYDFCYKEALYKMTKSVHKGNMQNLSILIGFVMGFGLMGFILLLLINFGVL